MKKIVFGLIFFSAAFNALAVNKCNDVLVEDSDISTGKVTAQGSSKYPLEFYESGNILIVRIHDSEFDFQTSPVYNDKWKKDDKLKMRTGLIETDKSSNQLIYIKDGNEFSGIQLDIKYGDKKRSFMGVNCIIEPE